MKRQVLTDVKALHTDRVSLVMVMGSPYVVTVHINDVFTTDGMRIVSLVLLPDPLRENPIHYAEVHMDRSILYAIVPHFTTFKRIPKPV
jgi:hypothetical protein